MEWKILFEDFFYIYPKILIPSGIVLNMLNLILFSTKKLSKLSISFLIKVIAITNILNLINFGLWSWDGPFHPRISEQTVFLCKMITINSYVLYASSNWILIFISVDRLVMIVFPKNLKLFEFKYLQAIVCTAIYVYNILFYIPTYVYYDIYVMNDDVYMNKTICDIQDGEKYYLITLMELVNSIAIPFFSTLFLSIFIIISLKKNKCKVSNASKLVTRRNIRDLKFSITILTLNFVFLSLNLPMSIGYLLDDKFSKTVGNFFMVVSISIDFFIFFATNSLVRRKCIILFFSAYQRFQIQISSTL